MSNLVSVDVKGIKEAMKLYDPKVVKTATTRAVKKTMGTVKTRLSTNIRKDYNIKKALLDPHMVVKAGSTTSMEANLQITGKPIPVADFGATLRKGQRHIKVRQRDAGAQVEIRKGRKQVLPHTFVIEKWQNVYIRTGKNRWPFRKVMGPSVVQLASDKVSMDLVNKTVTEELPKNFSNEMDYELSKVK